MDPGTFVCTVTKVAELVCKQQPSGDSAFVSWLARWQDFAGALLGALVGIAGALIVASASVRRQRTLAANLLLPEIEAFAEADGKLRKQVYPDDERAMWLRVNNIDLLQPHIESLHKEDVNQLLDIDERLHAHLLRLRSAQRDLKNHISKCNEAASRLRVAEAEQRRLPATATTSEKIRVDINLKSSQAAVTMSASMVTSRWWLCVQHAALAEYFIGRLAKVGWCRRSFRRARMWLFANDWDRKSAQMLKAIEKHSGRDADNSNAE